MNPREFITLAGALSKSGSPVECRTAIGRAYYSVFNVAVEHLSTVVPLYKGPQAHGQIQRCLAACSDLDIKRVGSDLGDLHSRRLDADYRMQEMSTEKKTEAQAAVIEAQDLIDSLDGGFAGTNAISAKRSIQGYWTGVLRESLRGIPQI